MGAPVRTQCRKIVLNSYGRRLPVNFRYTHKSNEYVAQEFVAALNYAKSILQNTPDNIRSDKYK